tara:strand:- start:287 stop:619 length:333 start_codon:yes stop_codon:yes gene_type:complete
MDIYTLVKGDSAPQIRATVTREDDGSAVSFAGGVVRMKFRKKDTTTVLFTMFGADSSGGDFANGIATFSFASGNLNLDAGYYQGEIEITYSDGRVETIYEIMEFYLRDDF